MRCIQSQRRVVGLTLWSSRALATDLLLLRASAVLCAVATPDVIILNCQYRPTTEGPAGVSQV